MTPKDFDLKKAGPEDIRGTTPEESAEITFKIVKGLCKKGDPKKDIVLVNAAAGIIVGGKAEDFNYGIEVAHESIESGAAYEKLKALIKICDGSGLHKLEELESKYG